MKIESSQANSIAPKQTGSAGPVEKKERTTGTTSQNIAGKDTASLSERARLLAKARTNLDETPDIRMEKVQPLREQILSGTYIVPIEKLAKTLLAHLKE